MSTVGTFRDDGFSVQQPFDAAIVIATIMRPSLAPALRSIFQQSFRSRTQIVLGIDKVISERGFLSVKAGERRETAAPRPNTPHRNAIYPHTMPDATIPNRVKAA